MEFVILTLEDELGELDDKHRQFVAVCELCAPQDHMASSQATTDHIRLQQQLERDLEAHLADLPINCDWGCKKNSQSKRQGQPQTHRKTRF